MTSITITLLWPPKELSPNARVHWATKSRTAARYKGACRALAFSQKASKLNRASSLLISQIFHPPDNRNRDIDNLQASMKSANDGIASAIGVDDSTFRYAAPIIGDVVKGGCVVVTVQDEVAA